eukprot:3496385-Prymnesium_polylepis.2
MFGNSQTSQPSQAWQAQRRATCQFWQSRNPTHAANPHRTHGAPTRTLSAPLSPRRVPPYLVAHGTFGALIVSAFEKRSEARPLRASAIALRAPRLA